MGGPILLDLVFEENRSRVVQLLVAFSLLTSVLFFALFSMPLLSCSAVAGVSTTALNTLDACLWPLFLVLAALASSRAQSRRLLLPALAAGVVYTIVAAVARLSSCPDLLKGFNPAGRIAVIQTAVELASSLVITLSLASLVLEDLPAALGAPRDAVATRRAHEVVMEEAHESERLSGAPAASALQLWLRDSARGVAAAPLRHHLAVLTSLNIIVTVAVVLGAELANLSSIFDASFSEPNAPVSLDVVEDLIRALNIGVALAAALVSVAVLASYADIYKDLQRLVAPGTEAQALKVGAVAGLRPSAPEAEVTAVDQALASPLVAAAAIPSSGDGSSAAAPALAPDGRACISREQVLLFTFPSSLSYPILYLANLLVVFVFAAAALSALTFFATSRATRIDALYVVISFVGSLLSDALVRWAYARWLVRDGSVLRPRALVLVDSVLFWTFAAASGLRSGLTRFAMGIFVLLFKMTRLSQPVAPTFAAWDAGFMSYGSMLRVATLANPDGAGGCAVP